MKNKHKILVLSDLKRTTKSTLTSTVSLAKMLDADVELFHVKKPTEIVDQENQLAARRRIVKQHVSTTKKIKRLLENVSKDYDVKITSSFSFGNVKAELEKHIKRTNPDIVVLGKRKTSPLKFSGDNITDFVLKTFKGSILIASEKRVLEPNKPLSVGLLNQSSEAVDMNFAKDLLERTSTPPKTFKIVNKTSGEYTPAEGNGTEFVFERNDNSVSNLSNYLMKNNINLAFLGRDVSGDKTKRNSISEFIRKIEVPILLSNDRAKMA